jgi:RNA polymerase sigma-70 factor (ECF subfamily)
MRWELNDLARRLDEQPAAVQIDEAAVPAPGGTVSLSPSMSQSQPLSLSRLTPNHRCVLEAIDHLPDDEREVFGLVRVQGLTHTEAAEVVGVSTKTIQRRLNRALVLLWKELAHLRPTEDSHVLRRRAP